YSATDYRTYSFGDPNYDGLATPVYFAEMLQSITDEATDRNGPLVRHALSILLSKTYAFITALDSELYRADRRYMDEFEWTLLRSTYNRQLRTIAKLLTNNAAALDPDYFREHADALASAEQRIASIKTNFSDEEWAALTDKNNWWE